MWQRFYLSLFRVYSHKTPQKRFHMRLTWRAPNRVRRVGRGVGSAGDPSMRRVDSHPRHELFLNRVIQKA